MELSIVLPIYNVETYLGTCLDSILDAKISVSYEVLLVLGPSTDRSTQLCQRYVETFPQMRLLRQDGKGLSNARNCGLKAAAGRWITFIDSDDFVRPLPFHRAVEEAISRGGEVLHCNYTMAFSPDHLYRCYDDISLPCEGAEGLCKLFSQYRCFWNTWRCIYSRSFLLEHELWFREGVFCEDLEHTTRVFLTANKLLFSAENYYCYRIARANSLMDVVTLQRLGDTVNMIEYSVALAKEAQDFPEAKDMIDQYVFEWILNLPLLYSVAKGERGEAIKLFRGSLDILSSAQSGWLKVAAFGIRLLGVRLTAGLLWIPKGLRRWRKSKEKELGR